MLDQYCCRHFQTRSKCLVVMAVAHSSDNEFQTPTTELRMEVDEPTELRLDTLPTELLLHILQYLEVYITLPQPLLSNLDHFRR